jgi:hypothetical protein
MKGTYLTYKAWLAAVRKAGAVRLDGDKDIATAFDSKGKGVGEWDGAEGYLYKGKSVASANPKGVYTTYSAWRAAAKKAGAVRFEGDKDIAQAFDATGRGVAEWDGAEGYIYRKSEMRNPMRREDPLYVKYLSLKSDEEPFMMQGTKYEYVWAEYPGGIKDIGVYSYANDLVYSYDSFRQMMNLPNPVTRRKGETARDFTARCMSEEKASFPKTKQRIAVCLSKSRKRNPLESGANISDDEDINVQASNMG